MGARNREVMPVSKAVTGTSPIDVLPECFRNKEDAERLDYIFDKAAANGRWSNKDVAWAICRMLNLICGGQPPK